MSHVLAGGAVKAYLGDGAYVDFDGYALVLTTENGIQATNTVVLEPEVWRELVQYVDAIKASQAEQLNEKRRRDEEDL